MRAVPMTFAKCRGVCLKESRFIIAYGPGVSASILASLGLALLITDAGSLVTPGSGNVIRVALFLPMASLVSIVGGRLRIALDATRVTVQKLETERQLRENLIAGLSHDLRTPLTVAKGHADLCLHHLDERRMCEAAFIKISNSVGRANQMIEDPTELTQSYAVPGLSYDAAAHAIVFQPESGAAVVCARLVRHHFAFIRWTSIDATGSCGLTRVEKVKRVIDDGTVPHEVLYLDAYFGVLPSERTGN